MLRPSSRTAQWDYIQECLAQHPLASMEIPAFHAPLMAIKRVLHS